MSDPPVWFFFYGRTSIQKCLLRWTPLANLVPSDRHIAYGILTKANAF